MTDKIKILFVNDEMRMGGVARVLNTLMAALPKDRYDIDLLVLHKRGMLLEKVPEGVRILEGTPFFHAVDLSLSDLWKNKDMPGIGKKLRLLFSMKSGLVKKRIVEERKKILDKQYDVEVAAKEGFCTIFTAYGDSRKKINWVLTDYSVCNYSSNHMNLVKQALQKIDLNIADSEQALIAYETVFRVYNGVAIHNLMDVDLVKNGMKEGTDEVIHDGLPNLITVARFHPQKSIDRLLNASKKAKDAGYRHHLYLIGGGELESDLRKQVCDLGLEDTVLFMGYRQNPYAMMADCDLFVLPSLYEGFATVISESLIAGTPVLTTDVSGAKEQITEEYYGWIVDNSQDGIDRGMLNALSDLPGLQNMKQNLAGYEYPNDRILKQFMEIFDGQNDGKDTVSV